MMRRAMARFFFFEEVACEIVKIDFLLDFVCAERDSLRCDCFEVRSSFF